MPTATRSKRTVRRPSAPPDHPVTAYARDVVSGRVVAGPWVRAAGQRHLDDLEREDIRFDPVAADHAMGFFPAFLRLTGEGQFDGQPFILQPWQQFILGSLFGWLSTSDGYRRYQHAYIECGKGAGKTPLLAGIGLYGLMFDDEPAAQIVCAARAREQARLMFDDAVKMARASSLAHRLDINLNNLADLKTGSWIRPVSAEAQTLEGKRVHMGLIDEVWTHPDASVINAIRKGIKARRQPMILEISNSGYDRTSVCWEHHEYSIHIVRGVMKNDAWFSYVCALDEGEDPFAGEACWVKANPNIEVSLPLKYLRGEVERARGMPSETGELLRKNFCVWSQQQTRYIPMDKWLATIEHVDDAGLVGVPCWGGLDLGLSADFSAFVIAWRLPDGRVPVRATFWVPRSTVQQHPGLPWDQWLHAGVLTIHERDATDFPLVEADIERLCRQHGVIDIGYDKRFAQQMALNLEGRGITPIDTGQGFQLNEALTVILDLVKTGRLLHGGNPVLTWMADNLTVKHGTKGEVRPVKPSASASAKIDGVVALAMAIDRMIRTGTSAYDAHDIREVDW